MAQKKKAVARRGQELKIARDFSKVQPIYANVVTVSTSPIDVRLIFGVFTQTGEAAISETYSHAVFLNPMVAKRLMAILTQHIDTLEKQLEATSDPGSNGRKH